VTRLGDDIGAKINETLKQVEAHFEDVRAAKFKCLVSGVFFIFVEHVLKA